MLKFKGIHADIFADQSGEIDIEGARMSGKTYLCAAKIWQSCIDHPGIWWLMCRFSGTETDNQLRPLFTSICRLQGIEPAWNDEESAYWFPERNGKVSKVFAYGLKTQSRDQRFAKIRGSGVAGLYVDQAEELPEDISTEMRALLRQPGYPHQLILSPNPLNEDAYLTDQFPDDNSIPGRKYYRLTLYDNAHNLRADTIEKLERAFPTTHVKHKSLILGMRGPTTSGVPVYGTAFDRDRHVQRLMYDDTRPVFEAIHMGQQHPVWLCAQRTYFGGLDILGGIMGKQLVLDQFLDIVKKYRAAWFPNDEKHPPRFKTCCDPPPEMGALRFSNVSALKRAGFTPVSKPNGTAPDVREAIINDLASQMRIVGREGFRANADPTKWLIASPQLEKQTMLFVDGLEASYVWDEHLVSVSNKAVRQPSSDQWVDGWQRCLENVHLNFCADVPCDAEHDVAAAKVAETKPWKPRSQWS